MAGAAGASNTSVPWGDNLKVEFEDGIAWVKLNRPQKRNAMSVPLAAEMNQVLDALELDDRCGVLVLTARAKPSPRAWTYATSFEPPTRRATWSAIVPTARRATGSGAS
jgi:enoyl-CoA hydratase/isomerase-like protein